jgi:hypothetical protein
MRSKKLNKYSGRHIKTGSRKYKKSKRLRKYKKSKRHRKYKKSKRLRKYKKSKRHRKYKKKPLRGGDGSETTASQTAIDVGKIAANVTRAAAASLTKYNINRLDNILLPNTKGVLKDIVTKINNEQADKDLTDQETKVVEKQTNTMENTFKSSIINTLNTLKQLAQTGEDHSKSEEILKAKNQISAAVESVIIASGVLESSPRIIRYFTKAVLGTPIKVVKNLIPIIIEEEDLRELAIKIFDGKRRTDRVRLISDFVSKYIEAHKSSAPPAQAPAYSAAAADLDADGTAAAADLDAVSPAAADLDADGTAAAVGPDAAAVSPDAAAAGLDTAAAVSPAAVSPAAVGPDAAAVSPDAAAAGLDTAAAVSPDAAVSPAAVGHDLDASGIDVPASVSPAAADGVF